MPATPEDLLAYLASLGVATETIEHPPLFTVEEIAELRGEIAGGHAKNLFVKDKKSRLFLLTLGEETADRPEARPREDRRAGAGCRSARPNCCEEAWGVRPGAVTPFGAINDATGRVTVVLDAEMMAHERVNFHPLVNTRTTGARPADLMAFLRATGTRTAGRRARRNSPHVA